MLPKDCYEKRISMHVTPVLTMVIIIIIITILWRARSVKRPFHQGLSKSLR